MKKIASLTLILMFLLVANVSAEPLSIQNILEKLSLKQGIAYSMIDHDINYLSTMELLSWKGFALEGGYSSKDKVVAIASYELLKLKDLGVSVPVLDLIEMRVGAYIGVGRLELTELSGKGNWEYDAGLSLTLIELRF